MSIPKKVRYAGENFWLQSTGRYYQGRKEAPERLLHRRIWHDAHGPIPAGYVVHHKNGDWQDNSLANLCLVENRQHMREHTAEHWQDPIYRQLRLDELAAMQEAAKAWHASPEGLAWHSAHGKKTWEERELFQRACVRCGETFETYFPDRGGSRATRFCSRACAQAVGYQRNKTATGICAWCGASFTYNKYRQQLCCSRLCSNQRRGYYQRIGEPHEPV